MDKKFHEGISKEEINVDALLDFLEKDNTYFVEDKNTGIVGNKRTGVMIDKRIGKVFTDGSVSSDNSKVDDSIKYDFLDYKKSVEVLNGSDVLKNPKPTQNLSEEISEPIKVDRKNLDKQKFKLRKNYEKLLKSREDLFKNLSKTSEKENLNLELENNLSLVEDNNLDNMNVKQQDNVEEVKMNESLSTSSDEVSLGDQVNISDEDLLNKINEQFDSQGSFGTIKENDFLKDFSSGDYNFSSFEDYENNSQEKSDVEPSEVKNIEEETPLNELDKFKMIIDFEDYILNMPSDEVILKSPFEDGVDVPKVVVESNKDKDEEDDDDSFSPFDAFEVEEIENFDIPNEQIMEEGMMSEYNLNQGISKKVSIREVIKNKRKKKQEQKELQEKLFFETIDERIEQFKKFEEHHIDSQEILNAINMDLNKINSSIKVEFETLNRKSKARTNSKERKSPPKSNNKEDKFSLQNLLEEIYEENGEKPSNLDTNELDIDSIKKDLAKKERNKNIVN